MADAIDVSPAYAQQLCIRLRVHGLIGESSPGITFGSGPPTTFMPMGFADTLLGYINEPT